MEHTNEHPQTTSPWPCPRSQSKRSRPCRWPEGWPGRRPARACTPGSPPARFRPCPAGRHSSRGSGLSSLSRSPCRQTAHRSHALCTTRVAGAVRVRLPGFNPCVAATRVHAAAGTDTHGTQLVHAHLQRAAAHAGRFMACTAQRSTAQQHDNSSAVPPPHLQRAAADA